MDWWLSKWLSGGVRVILGKFAQSPKSLVFACLFSDGPGRIELPTRRFPVPCEMVGPHPPEWDRWVLSNRHSWNRVKHVARMMVSQWRAARSSSITRSRSHSLAMIPGLALRRRLEFLYSTQPRVSEQCADQFEEPARVDSFQRESDCDLPCDQRWRPRCDGQRSKHRTSV